MNAKGWFWKKLAEDLYAGPYLASLQYDYAQGWWYLVCVDRYTGRGRYRMSKDLRAAARHANIAASLVYFFTAGANPNM